MANRFAHLHLHSEYSLLDGGNRVGKLVDRIKELGMDSVALTDHGNLFGSARFYSACKEAGIKPILGLEAYVAPDVAGSPGDRRVKEFRGVADGGFHLVLLCENETGWKNLLKLSSDSYIEGFYYRPRTDKAMLEQWHEGLIAINGHLGSSIAYHLSQYESTRDKAHWERARREAQWHAETFGVNEQGEPRFYLELQRHDDEFQEKINQHVLRLARELSLPLVADNDAHFMTLDDWDAHDTLICVSMGKTKDTEQRLRYSKELYVKSEQQMAKLFEDVPEAIENTGRIAQRCNVDIDFDANHAPVVKIAKTASKEHEDYPTGSTEWYKAFCAQYELQPYDSDKDTDSADELKAQCDSALRELCEAGLTWRYGEGGVTDEHRARLDRELGILADKLISAYFLIVWDFVNYARSKGIPCNARGSGVGTMVGYVLGLSNACPVEYGLLFERFTDPNRSEYPDIDIDMCQDGRQDVLEYVRQKYGYVAQIVTFNVMKAKQAVRDVGRVHNLDLADVDKVCKLIGDGLGVTLNKAYDQEPDLKKLLEDNPQIRGVWDTAKRLEGISRHTGIHAAGVIIATQPLQNIVPLAVAKQQQKEILITQWDGPTCERAGLLKMDFLGLKTLSIIEKAVRFIRETLDEETIKQTVRPDGDWPDDWDPLDLERLSYDDQKVLDLYRRAETKGTFQFESDGMRNMLLQMKPDRLEDLIAGNALFRPGPMALIDDYCDRKHGKAEVPKVHPIVDKFTAPTYGIMVYQEQVMQIVHELGGIPLRDAYSLIKAISKKKESIINANRAKFIEGAGERGLDKNAAEGLFELILKFAGYGFNKSHSAGYSIVAYKTAYLKTYFPAQYMAAVLSYDADNTDKIVAYFDECKAVMRPNGSRGAEVRPPSVNSSEVGFTVVYEDGEPRDANHGHIRFGMSAVKGVGEKAIRGIIAAREKDGPFESLYDFCERVPLDVVSRAVVEALIKCGAFDTIHGIKKRAAMVEALDSAIQSGHRAQADKNSGQMNFFGTFQESASNGNEKAAPASLPNVPAWAKKQTLEHEKSVLGFYVSSNPLDELRDTFDRFGNITIADIKSTPAEVEVVFGAMLAQVRPTVTKRGRNPGQRMAMVTMEDRTGKIDGVVFSDTFAVCSPLLQSDAILFFKGKVDRRREEPSIIVSEVFPVEQAAAKLTQMVKIVIRDPNGNGPLPDAKRNGNGNGRHHEGYRLNGELQNLKALLTQARPSNGDRGAEVMLEIHQGGKVTRLRLNGLRIGVDRDLPERINTVMHAADSCELLGPRKLVQVGTATQVTTGEIEQPRLRRNRDDDEQCDSIDRY